MADSHSENKPIADTSSDHPTRYLPSVVIATLVGAAIVFLLQRFLSINDHQNANLFSFAVIFITFFFCWIQIHRLAREHWHRAIIPMATLALLVLFFVLFRFDGFSGEMMPQFKLRYWNRSSAKPVLSQSESLAPTEMSDRSHTSQSSTSFLGSERNGVIANRLFSVPKHESDLLTLWDQGIGEGWSSFAVEDDRAVTLEQRDDRECVTCYRLGDGEVFWSVSHVARHENPLGGVGPRSTPTIAEGRVYALGATGTLWCIDLQSGSILWSNELLQLAGWNQSESENAIPWGRAASPLVVDGLCIVPFGAAEPDSFISRSKLADRGRTLIAFDIETGDIRWNAGKHQISYSSPVAASFDGIRQIVSVNQDVITGHAIDDGAELWSFEWLGSTSTNANCSSIVFAGDNRFLIGKGYGGGSALIAVTRDESNIWSADDVWTSSRVLKTKFTHPALRDGVAYALSDGTLQAVDIESGKPLWQQPRSDRSEQGQLMLAEDTLVVQTEPGEVLFVEATPEEYRVLGQISALSSKTWNIPTIAGRHLIVRNDRQVICYFLPGR